MNHTKTPIQIILTVILLISSLLSACSGTLPNISIPSLPSFQSNNNPSSESTELPIAKPIADLPETIIDFEVIVPENTPPDEPIFINILDEVTGLALNTQLKNLEPEETADTPDKRVYKISLPFSVGSIIKYRYERQTGNTRVSEHAADGSPIRYRLFYVTGPGKVVDYISRWTDTEFEDSTGRIMGKVLDQDTGQPIPNLLAVAGGIQTTTKSDGSFILEGLPPGIHNLVIYSLDGHYQTFQQGAKIAAESSTPAEITLKQAAFVKVVFVVQIPEDTPPVIPIRLAGNLYQLGNSFASLSGGINSVVGNMPTLNQLPDGRYQVTVSLPIGAYIRYKYTLGDGFWNAEHTPDGDFNLREFVVPAENALVEDEVATWHSGDLSPITFDVTVPANTPADEFVAIQFDPLFGWTEPIPMWHMSENRWAYMLYSPLNLPGNIYYRYCRNGQCGYADDAQTPGLYGQGRVLRLDAESKIINDTVSSWINWNPELNKTPVITNTIQQRDSAFWSGISLEPNFHPSWMSLFDYTLSHINDTGANWLVLSPTWTYNHGEDGNNPPLLAPSSGIDPYWFETVKQINESHEQSLNIALYPSTNMKIETVDWWKTADRDFGWWILWFNQYEAFVNNYADLATQNNVEAMILGGSWLNPALPSGQLADGSFSGVPADAEARWRKMIHSIREKYSGELLWALPIANIDNPPAFIDEFDKVYLLVDSQGSPENITEDSVKDLESEINLGLDAYVKTIQSKIEKPVIIGLSFPSNSDPVIQAKVYNLMLEAVNQRSWISGFIARGYYPPVTLQNTSNSIHGKPANEIVKMWFTNWMMK